MVPLPPFRRFAKRLRPERIARNPRRNPRGKRGREGVRRTTVVLGHRDLGEGYRMRLGRRTERSSRGGGAVPPRGGACKVGWGGGPPRRGPPPPPPPRGG